MAEEFNKILDELNKKPVQEKINGIFDIIKNLIKITLKMSDEFNKKITKIEINIKKCAEKIELINNNKLIETIPFPPSPPPQIKTSPLILDASETKKVLMSELKELFQEEIEKTYKNHRI